MEIIELTCFSLTWNSFYFVQNFAEIFTKLKNGDNYPQITLRESSHFQQCDKQKVHICHISYAESVLKFANIFMHITGKIKAILRG